MSYPISTKRNPYYKNKKNSTVCTPVSVSHYLYSLIRPVLEPKVILDPSIGQGSLIKDWYSQCHIIGIDINPKSDKYAHQFICSKFEEITNWNWKRPDLVLCNPPFNGAPKKKLYPEIFFRHMVSLFGANIPIVLFVPMGFRLNQKLHSQRWQWMRDNQLEISSIITLPLDIFPNVKFHSEILIFNIPGLKAHYWLDKNTIAA